MSGKEAFQPVSLSDLLSLTGQLWKVEHCNNKETGPYKEFLLEPLKKGVNSQEYVKLKFF